MLSNEMWVGMGWWGDRQHEEALLVAELGRLYVEALGSPSFKPMTSSMHASHLEAFRDRAQRKLQFISAQRILRRAEQARAALSLAFSVKRRGVCVKAKTRRCSDPTGLRAEGALRDSATFIRACAAGRLVR